MISSCHGVLPVKFYLLNTGYTHGGGGGRSIRQQVDQMSCCLIPCWALRLAGNKANPIAAMAENLNVFFEFTAILPGISSDGREKRNRE
jgi:hypothetical protein